MSKKHELEHICDLLTNGEADQAAAEALLHEYFVKQAQAIYEAIASEEDMDDKDDIEIIGSSCDAGEDFIAAVTADKDEIESDELSDGLPMAADEESDEEAVEDKEEASEELEDLKSQMADLMAEFSAFLDGGVKVDESIDSTIADVSAMNKEGKVNPLSVLTKEKDVEVKPRDAVDFASPVSDKETPAKADMIKYDQAKSGEAHDESKELDKSGSALVGTGKNSTKGAMNPKAPLTDIK